MPFIRMTAKVVPAASRDEIVGWMGEVLKVRVAAPPEHGRANEAVCALIADALKIAVHRVRVVSGGASPKKIIEIDAPPTALKFLRRDAGSLNS